MANQHTSEWTNEIVQRMMELAKEHQLPEVTELLNTEFNTTFTYTAVRTKYTRSKKKNITFIDRKNIGNTIEDYIQHLIKHQEERQKFDDRQTSITLDIDGDKPIGIVFTGDWHVGGLYTAHKEMLEDFKVISETDGLYNIAMGDYADNYNSNSHKGGMFEQIENPDKQKDLVQYLFTEFLGNSNLAIIRGNHDYWETKETSEDFVKRVARLIDSPYLWYGGEINLRLGSQVYKIIARHTFQGNSALNTTNSQRRLFDETQGDVVALGHLHYNEIHSKTKAGKDTVWIRTGTYKRTDDYTQWVVGGSGRGDIRQPMIILFPDKKEILDFRDMYRGIEYLKMLRQGVTV
ncbi:calcineurin-like phosphoesterase family protein [Bacillus oleivorans]|uniref:Calcineurin-like phosphoesterase family protein n=1 Tax=Bacillus oleivorans TaxID=1448271 RepID=A0A285D673_9BACI|nr:metallophosphoesterase [Bacillus oleivorans]SNX75334.1 calcineurin-like phosphoesterase family protein [Bacillus oleivorans]